VGLTQLRTEVVLADDLDVAVPADELLGTFGLVHEELLEKRKPMTPVG
jgi:hypothetical protein